MGRDFAPLSLLAGSVGRASAQSSQSTRLSITPQELAIEHAKFKPVKIPFDSSHLTDREKDMMRLLAAVPGETVPRQMLAGNGASAAGERAVDVQVNRLRRKIEVDPANPLFVQTVRGIGYRLVVVT